MRHATSPAGTLGPGTASLSRQRGAEPRLRSGDREGHVGKSAVDAFDPQRLRHAREAAGLTQRDLAIKVLEAELAGQGTELSSLPGEKWARAVETERIRIISYENGAHAPRAPMLHRLAQALAVDGFALLKPDTPRDLATLRTRLGLTQADVAAQLQTVGRAYYSRVEQGIAALQDEHDQRRLAEVLQVDPAEVRALAARPSGGTALPRRSAGKL